MFDETISNLNDWIDAKSAAGAVRQYEVLPSGWPQEKSMILQSDMGMELGNPMKGSLSLLVWAGGDASFETDEILLIGPDLPEAQTGALPLARIVLVEGEFADEYESYRELLGTAYDLSLRGVTSRSLPSRQEIWLRVSRDALNEGMDLQVMGNALMGELKRLESVRKVRILYVTAGKDVIEELRPVADKARAIIDTLVKIYDEMTFDCDDCDNQEICDDVVELRAIHERLKGSK